MNEAVALMAGMPSSVTRTVMRLVPGDWDEAGGQEKRPLTESIVAPDGAPGSRLKRNVSVGAPVALAFSKRSWLSITTWSGMGETVGGVFELSRMLAPRGVGAASVNESADPSG